MALIDRIDTVFVPAIDTSTAAAWYGRMFGMTPIFESAGYIGLRLPGGEAALTLYPAPSIDRDGHYRFNFYSSDPEGLRQAIVTEGLEATPIKDAGPIRYFDFRDVSGNWINICAPGRG